MIQKRFRGQFTRFESSSESLLTNQSALFDDTYTTLAPSSCCHVLCQKKKNTEEADLIIPGKRTWKALSSARLKASVEDAELSSDSNTEALNMTKKAKKETKATKGTKRKLKGKAKESSDEEIEVIEDRTVIIE